MGISLYDVIIPSYRQILGTMLALVDKAEAHCAAQGLEPEALIEARLIDDMLPFAYQVKSTAIHSLGAIEGVRKGVFSPDRTTPPTTFDGLRGRVREALAGLEAVTPAEMEGLIGRDMRFEAGAFVLDFTAENFLLSFSKPNFLFHATTAYDILRMKGVGIGKRDFLGKMAIKA